MHKRYANKRYRNYPRSKNSGSILKKVINYYLPDCLGTFRSTFSLHRRRGSEETAICFTIMHFFFLPLFSEKLFGALLNYPLKKFPYNRFIDRNLFADVIRVQVVRTIYTRSACTRHARANSFRRKKIAKPSKCTTQLSPQLSECRNRVSHIGPGVHSLAELLTRTAMLITRWLRNVFRLTL